MNCITQRLLKLPSGPGKDVVGKTALFLFLQQCIPKPERTKMLEEEENHQTVFPYAENECFLINL